MITYLRRPNDHYLGSDTALGISSSFNKLLEQSKVRRPLGAKTPKRDDVP